MKPHMKKFIDALIAWRQTQAMTQDVAAGILGVSPRAYVLFESGRWSPSERERHALAHALHEYDPSLAEAFARAHDAASAPAAVGAAQAAATFDSALMAAAEALEVSGRTLRPVVATLLEQLQKGGVTMEQAASAARSGRSGRKKGARKGTSKAAERAPARRERGTKGRPRPFSR